MDFNITKEQKLLQQLYKDFTENEVKPIAAEVDEEERFPIETVEKMQKYGMVGIPIPKEYGGEGGDNLSYIMLVEELAKACATTSVVLSAHTSLCCAPIYEFGTEYQKEKYLVPLAKGELLGAFGLTEPNAGTDAAGQQTKAVLDGDNYIINGSKIFITNASYADVFIIFAMTDKSKGTRGISAFIMEKEFEGFSIGKKELKMGIRGSATCELIFDNVKVPKENLIGKVGKGFGIAMKTLDGGRIGIAAQALGIAQGAIDETVKYVKERKQFGRSISKFQNTQFELAEMQTRTDAARLLVYRATKAVQLHGGYGYTREYPVERMMRDAKITEIYEGTSEVQKMVVAANML